MCKQKLYTHVTTKNFQLHNNEARTVLVVKCMRNVPRILKLHLSLFTPADTILNGIKRSKFIAFYTERL